MKVGIDGKAYVSATNYSPATWGGTPAVPVLTEWDLVEDIQQELADDEAVFVNRRGRFKTFGRGKSTIGYTIRSTYKPGDTAFDLVYNAFLNKTTIALAVADTTITVSQTKAWTMDVDVFAAPHNEALSEGDSITFILKPSHTSNYPPTRTTTA